MSTKFDPQEWLDKAKAQTPDTTCRVHTGSEVDTVIARIEAELADIAPTYADWLNLGFAFASEFGEAGRTFYHRVSRFYNGYTKAETDKQYDQCLKSQGHGITISTFFYLAKQAGVEVGRHGAGGEEQGGKGMGQGAGGREEKAGSREQGAGGRGISMEQDLCTEPQAPCSSPHALEDDPPAEEEQMPTLPDEIFDRLPRFFQQVVALAVSKEERDILFLGSLVTVSVCLAHLSGIYDGKKVYANLYLYVTARASAGKGRLVLCRNLVQLIHREKRRAYMEALQRYEVEMREYNAMKSKDMELEKPQKPPVQMLFIPANNSTTGFFQILSDNQGQGLIFETEGDTIAQSFKTDFSNFSDGFRKAFHHESISYYRRTDREYVEIDSPCVSTVISSTLGQMLSLIPSVENGLTSRFMFYFMNMQPVWKDVFANTSDQSLEEHFNNLGREFYAFYNSLKEKDPMIFQLSPAQQQAFNTFFSQVQVKYLVLQGMETISIIRRLGLIAFRLMMVLSALRMAEGGEGSDQLRCSDEDFQTGLAIIKTLVRHASHVFSQLPPEVKTEKRPNKKERFFEALPPTFDSKTFLELAKSLQIAERTAYKYIVAYSEKGLVEKIQSNEYVKKKE